MEPIRLGLVGCGTVGTGVARLLLEQRELLLARTGIPLELTRVADLDSTTDRGVRFAPGVLIDDARRIIDDPRIDIVAEMVGGDTFAKDLILSAMAKGKHVVTANKALLARHGNQLFAAATAQQVDLAFEASVCGCMPIIKTLREALVANRISALIGILNGTSNYILSKITAAQVPFAAALAEAQAHGYAEADPTLDIEGFDAAHKLAILTALAYGTPINFDDIYIEGITAITPLDIQLAAEFGYRIKLLAISKLENGRLDVRVHPTMIPMDNILSNVSGTLNAITVSGHAAGDLFISGHGAGMLPTASAVLSDIVDLARNIRYGAAGRIPPAGHQADCVQAMPTKPLSAIAMRYYFRFSALDQPGVLSAIAGILGRHGISIASVQQKGRKSSGTVPIVMMTHRVKEADVRDAFTAIKALDTVGAAPVLIRIEDDQPEE